MAELDGLEWSSTAFSMTRSSASPYVLAMMCHMVTDRKKKYEAKDEM